MTSGRGRTIAIAVATVAVIVVVLVYLVWLRVDDGLADPAKVELPAPPDDSAATLEFLNGPEGTPLLRAVEITDSLATTTSTSACAALLERLDEVGSPQALFAAAAGIPDPATGEMAVHHLDAVATYLGECISGSEADPEESEFTGEVLRRRLEQLG